MEKRSFYFIRGTFPKQTDNVIHQLFLTRNLQGAMNHQAKLLFSHIQKHSKYGVIQIVQRHNKSLAFFSINNKMTLPSVPPILHHLAQLLGASHDTEIVFFLNRLEGWIEVLVYDKLVCCLGW
ncbi:hypothetical protein NE237_019246 [Protea cynaroides]|uniref:Uncharacterized protein n=1 Tax=Protea cynaroides TaxID=273540 RepID=A0A9Q0KBG2_9MAGN|nr:hypothetical protein NE237_019246 [Protea cynaroides]